jgi:hypothetical protein
MTLMIESAADVACPACNAEGFVDPTCEQVAEYGLLPGTLLRCGGCDGSGRAPEAELAA